MATQTILLGLGDGGAEPRRGTSGLQAWDVRSE